MSGKTLEEQHRGLYTCLIGGISLRLNQQGRLNVTDGECKTEWCLERAFVPTF